jgi:hypothetical protein
MDDPLCGAAKSLRTKIHSNGRGSLTNGRISMLRYISGSGTTTELVVLQVILAAIWSANLHFHWFQ